jgi:hypothetical protein
MLYSHTIHITSPYQTRGQTWLYGLAGSSGRFIYKACFYYLKHQKLEMSKACSASNRQISETSV